MFQWLVELIVPKLPPPYVPPAPVPQPPVVVPPEERAARQRVSFVLDFVDKNYNFGYRFEFRWEEPRGYWTIWCRAHPPFPAGVVPIHLLAGNQVCVTFGREPRSLSRAKAIAYLWMRGCSTYAVTGTFPNGAEVVNIPD